MAVKALGKVTGLDELISNFVWLLPQQRPPTSFSHHTSTLDGMATFTRGGPPTHTNPRKQPPQQMEATPSPRQLLPSGATIRARRGHQLIPDSTPCF